MANETTKNVKAVGCNNTSFLVNKLDTDMWHKRLGHPCEKIMKIVFKTLNVNGDFHNFSFCKDCHYGKHHQGHFPMSQSRAKKPLELIHSDVWGPAPILSREGFKYYIHFVDDHTRYTWMFP